MTVTPSPLHFDIRRPDLDRPARTSGIHVSDLLSTMGLRMGYLKGDHDQDTIQGHKDALAEYAASTDGHSPLLSKIALGLAWEDWYMPQVATSPYFPGVESEFDYHPGEIYLDGVAGSPDGLEWVPSRGIPVVHECKLTWDHGSTAIESKWLWLSQVRTYCYMLGTPFAALHVCYVNGFMKGDSKRAKAGMPYGQTYRLEFTKEELVRTWASVHAAKRELEREQQTDTAEGLRGQFEVLEGRKRFN